MSDLPVRVRWPFALAAAGLCVVGATAALGWTGADGTAAAPAGDAITPQPRLAGFTARRLATELGTEYGFHFMPPTVSADPGGVDMATAQDAGGDQLRVIVFGRTPQPVHAFACEFTPAHTATAGSATAAAGFLSACARLGAGTGQAAVAAAGWAARAQAGLAALPETRPDDGRLTETATFGPVGFAVRRLPGTGEWIMSVTGETR